MRVAFFPHFTQEFHREKGFGVDRHKLPIPVVARYIRFKPTKHILWVCLRVEVYGIFKGELILNKHDKWILNSYTAVSRVKVNATTPEGIVRGFQVNVPWLQDFREIWEIFAVRKRHCGFDELTCLFRLLKFVDYRILRLPSRLSRALLSLFFRQIFSKQPHVFIEKLPESVWNLVYNDVTQFKLFPLHR